jgi:hypothetical protein
MRLTIKIVNEFRGKNPVKKLFIFFTVLKTVKKSKKTVKKLFIFFAVFYFLHRFQLCAIFIYFFSLFLPSACQRS